MKTIGIDIGSSSVKVSILDTGNGTCQGWALSPENEMEISSRMPGWAEQSPFMWWDNVIKAVRKAVALAGSKHDQVKAIGITYQMHGLVCLDKFGKPVRPSIIWCDSRAVETGTLAFEEIGKEKCLSHLLNSPGNFTASKLAWVKVFEPELYEQIDKIMLPGDYIAYRLTDEISTTQSGLSEGIFWDFKEDKIAGFLLEYYGLSAEMLPSIVPAFGIQGKLSKKAATELGLKAGIPISFRAGDQATNAFALNVMKPRQVAASAGTSGVVYEVLGQLKPDPNSRINLFAHLNHTNNQPRIGALLCINGAGILYSWLKRMTSQTNFDEMNRLSSRVSPGSDGLTILPFGNGAERMLDNQIIGGQIIDLDFVVHTQAHLYRAAQEGIAFAFKYGMNMMQDVGDKPSIIRAGETDMFLSPLFCKTLASITDTSIELFNTDNSLGAARGAALGAGIYSSLSDCFRNLLKTRRIDPDLTIQDEVAEAYEKWLKTLQSTSGIQK